MDNTKMTEASAPERNLVDVAKLAAAARDAGRSLRQAGDAVKTLTAALPRSTTLPMLAALHMTGKPIYAGTADPVTVAKRRAANRVARRQRRVNNQRNFRKGVR
jgi:hypothetical protein